MKNNFFLLTLILLIASCNTNSKSDSAPEQKIPKENAFEVFNGSNKEDVAKYQTLGLDDRCPNLLDPSIGKDEIDQIRAAWMDLNQAIGKHLAENKFEWGTDEPMIRAWHKFYFHKDGRLNKYLFNFRGDAISKEKKEHYKKLMQKFANTYQLPLTKDSEFAQCGSAVFQNS